MRIGFTGASGSGKSTLATKLLEVLPEYTRYEPIQRRMTNILPSFPTSKSTTDLSQCFITSNIIITLLNNDNLISDRTIIDAFVYAVTSPKVTMHGEIIKTFESLISLYDVIFYCPYGEFDLINDDIREPDNEYHVYTDKLIQEYIEKYKNKTKIIRVTGSINKRFNTIINILKEINAI